MTTRKEQENLYLDTPQSNIKNKKSENILDQNNDIEILARIDPPDGFEEDISYQSTPNNALQSMLSQLAEQLLETRAQMAAQQQELDSLKQSNPKVELEMATKTPPTTKPPVMEEVIKKTIIENIARFDAALAPTSASMSRNFFASLESAFDSLQIQDDRQQTAILRSKMVQNDTTNSWLSSTNQDGTGPISVAQWKAIIERDFRPRDLIEIACQKLNNLQMGKDANLLVASDSATTARN